MNIPYETTKVPVERSLAGISSFLDRVGFTSSATINENSRRRIIAKIDGIAFEWAADIPGIQKAYGEAHGGRYLREDQAGRIAWRAIYYGVEAQSRSILCGATTIAIEFGGQILLPNGQTVATRITADYKTGRLAKPTIALLAAPEEGG